VPPRLPRVPALRPLLVGCVLVCALVTMLLASGCGSSDPTDPTTISSREAGRFHDLGSYRGQKGGNDTAKAGKSGDSGRHVPAGDLCQSQLGSFVGSMDGLRRRLAVGVTYDQYVAEVRGIRSTYGEIPTGRLRIDCLTAVATPGEKAFNRYIEAANDWGECVSELGCGSAEIEPVLQRRWRIASHFLSEAEDGLRSIA
jgi:hypothetical protein